MGSAWAEIKELHRSSTAGAKEGIAFRYFSRPLASFILYFIQNGRITPNQVTILSLLVGLVGFCVQMIWLSWAGLLVGGALFMAAHVLDALDGQLARRRKAGSVVGMYFDFFIDELKAYALFIAIGVRLYLQVERGHEVPRLLQPLLDLGGSPAILLVALIGLCGLAVGISCTQFVKRKEWLEAFPPGTGGGQPSPLARLIGLIEKAGKLVIDYPSYIILLCLIDMIEIYFLLYAVVVCLYATRALAQISLKLWRINPYK